MSEHGKGQSERERETLADPVLSLEPTQAEFQEPEIMTPDGYSTDCTTQGLPVFCFVLFLVNTYVVLILHVNLKKKTQLFYQQKWTYLGIAENLNSYRGKGKSERAVKKSIGVESPVGVQSVVAFHWLGCHSLSLAQ